MNEAFALRLYVSYWQDGTVTGLV